MVNARISSKLSLDQNIFNLNTNHFPDISVEA